MSFKLAHFVFNPKIDFWLVSRVNFILNVMSDQLVGTFQGKYSTFGNAISMN